MPLGLFLALASCLVAPGVGGGGAKIRDRPPVLGTPDFRILAEISDQNDLVYASRHRRSPLPEIIGLDPPPPARAPVWGPPWGSTLYGPRTGTPDDPRLSTY